MRRGVSGFVSLTRATLAADVLENARPPGAIPRARRGGYGPAEIGHGHGDPTQGVTQVMDGYTVVTSDGDKIGTVVGEEAGNLIVQTGMLRHHTHAIPKTDR